MEIQSLNEEQEKSDSNIVVASTQSGICMVEGHCNNASEQELIDLLLQAHELNQEQINWQLQIQAELGITKSTVPSKIDFESWTQRVSEVFTLDVAQTLFAPTKDTRSAAMDKVEDMIKGHFAADIEAGNVTTTVLNTVFESILAKHMPDLMAKTQTRVDGLSFSMKLDQFIQKQAPCLVFMVQPFFNAVNSSTCKLNAWLWTRRSEIRVLDWWRKRALIYVAL